MLGQTLSLSLGPCAPDLSSPLELVHLFLLSLGSCAPGLPFPLTSALLTFACVQPVCSAPVVHKIPAQQVNSSSFALRAGQHPCTVCTLMPLHRMHPHALAPYAPSCPCTVCTLIPLHRMHPHALAPCAPSYFAMCTLILCHVHPHTLPCAPSYFAMCTFATRTTCHTSAPAIGSSRFVPKASALASALAAAGASAGAAYEAAAAAAAAALLQVLLQMGPLPVQ